MKPRRLLLAAIALAVLALAGTVLWIGGSESGLRFVLERVRAAVPGFDYQHAQGRLSGEFALHGVRLQRPDLRVSAVRLSARLDPGSLLGGSVHFTGVRIEGLRVQRLPAPTVAATTPTRVALPNLRVEALSIEDAVLVAADGGELTRASLSATLELRGRMLRLSQLQLRGSDWQGAGGLTIDLSDPWWLDQADLDFEAELRPGVRAKGRLQRLRRSADRAFRVRLEQPLRADLELRPGPSRQVFAADIHLPTQAATVLGLPATQPVAADLRLRGEGEQLALSGRLQVGEQPFAIADSRIKVRSGRVRIDALALDLPNAGRVRIDADLPLTAAEALTLQLHSDELRIAAGTAAPWRIAGDIAIAGNWRQPTATPDFAIRRGDWPELRVTGTLALETEQLRLAPLRLHTATGELAISGQIGRDAERSATLDLELSDFDPGTLLPDWPGRIRGNAHWQGRLAPGAADGRLRIEAIEGRLREQPVRIAGSVQWSGRRIEHADIDARLGPNFLRLNGDNRGGGALNVVLDAPLLSALWPGAGGALSLTLERGRDWAIQATASALQWQDLAVAGFSLSGRLPLVEPFSAASLHGRLTGLRQGNILIDSARFDVEGGGDRQRIELELRRLDSQLSLAAQGGWSQAGWRGRLAAAELRIGHSDRLRLAAPTALLLGSARSSLDTACIAAAAGGRVCLELDHDRAATTLALQLERMPIDGLAALVPASTRPRLLPRGRVDGQARLSWRQGVLAQASAELRAERIDIGAPDSDELTAGLRDLAADLAFADGRGRANLRTALNPDGRIEAGMELVTTADGALHLDGDIVLTLQDLALLELLSPELAHPRGRLDGRLHLSGPWRSPDWRGTIALSDFDAELPRLGLHLQHGQGLLAGRAGQLTLDGSVQSGPGVLHFDGRFEPGAATAFSVRVHGERVELANTNSVALVATPELTLRHDRDGWRWLGRIEVPSARIDAERLAPVQAHSADVVVIDDPPSDAAGFGTWRADVEFILGDQVRVKGYGFDGKLGGTLRVSQRHGRAAVASGQLEVEGDYRAYGQKLKIERGRLAYAGSGLDEPSLDLRAERKVGATTVGIHITGTARRPLSQVYSNPALGESEALALLVTGRPLNQVRSNDQSRLSRAALALGSIGGDMLAGNLGLDELRLGSDDTLQGDAFAVGKFLTPRLYVGYAVALLTRGEVFTVRYRVSKHIDIEAHASERNRLLLNYRIER